MDQLFNYASNIFVEDYSSYIGIEPQKDMRLEIMSGLANLLKGSLSNSILGNHGGYEFEGQNITAKAVLFDELTQFYNVTVPIPASLQALGLTTDQVNISLPNATSGASPCMGLAACQVSLILLDEPVTSFLSNSKDAQLNSLVVDLGLY